MTLEKLVLSTWNLVYLKFSLHIFYIFKKAWNFFTKFWYSNQMFSRNISQMWRGGAKRFPLPKICRAYPTMMKLVTAIPYLKKIQKVYQSHDKPPDVSIFSPEISKFCYIKKYRYRSHFDTLFLILLIFLESEDFFNKTGYNFDDVSKNSYPRPS